MKLIRKQRKGFTLIELLIVIAVIAILASIAIPNLLASRESANEASAIGSVRTIDSAEATYRSRNANYTDLTTLDGAGLVDPSVAAGAKSGFSMYAIPGDGLGFTNADTKFFVLAVPASSSSGQRDFYSDETGVIFTTPDTDGTHSHLPGMDASGVAPTGWTQVGN